MFWADKNPELLAKPAVRTILNIVIKGLDRKVSQITIKERLP